MNEKNSQALWQACASRYTLTQDQLAACQRYATMLLDWNKRMNLTAIESIDEVIGSHFMDSLEITRFLDMSRVHMIADVGTGAGFPGLPLKIKFPHLRLLLIEVNQKKVRFLQEVIAELGLEHVEICSLDWRTFLRDEALPIDLFVARASLQTEELVRIFKPQSAYKQATLVYWASQHWQADKITQPYVYRTESYEIMGKKRHYIFYRDKQS